MAYKIPLFDLNYGVEEETAVIQTLRSRWISMGEKTKEVEKNFADHLEVAETILVTNCTTALFLALKTLGIGPGDQVIVPSLTFVATVNAVCYTGATPVFADIMGPENLSLSPGEVEQKIGPQTKAIMVMHYGGFGCPMEKFSALAKKHHLYLIEDSAHAPNSDYQGKKLGSWGDIACLSFFSNKNISCGEGGLLATSNGEWAQKIRLMRSHGMTSLSFERARGHATAYDVIELGYNFRIDDIRSALLLAQWKKLPADTARRKELRQRYIQQLEGIEEIYVPYRDFPHQSSNYIFPILLKKGGVEKRDHLRQYLATKGIQTSVHYPAVHHFSIYQDQKAFLPQTEFATTHEITLPLYFSLKEEEVDYICQSLKDGILEGR